MQANKFVENRIRFKFPGSTRSDAPIDYSDRDVKINRPLYIEGEPVADFIVEQGRSGTWTYEKWASGKAVYYGKQNYGSVPCNNAWQGWYETEILTLDLPDDFFVDVPQYIDLRLIYGGSVGYINHGSIAPTKNKITYAIVRPNAVTYQNCTVGFYVVGIWK